MQIDFRYTNGNIGIIGRTIQIDTDSLDAYAASLEQLLPPTAELEKFDGQELKHEDLKDGAWYELQISSPDINVQVAMDSMTIPDSFGPLVNALREKVMAPSSD